MKKLKDKIISFLGLKGSWSWACKQMDKGEIVRPANATGTVKYKLDSENQRRIMWCFNRDYDELNWSSANIFLSDFENTNWIVWSKYHE